MKMQCIIADDEPIARKGLEGYVEKVPFLELVATVQDGLAVIEKLSLEPVDLLILDINMPHLSGIQMMRTLKQPPLAIFVTAHPEYAVEGFELDVVDYIVKPVSFERFLKAVHKAKEYAALKQAGKVEASYFFIKEGSTIEKIILDEIVFIQSLQNYSAIYTTDRKYMALLSLKQLEENIPKDQFLKVHKSYIVNTRKLSSIEGDEILIGTNRIPIGRSMKEEVLASILKSKLLRRDKHD